MFQKSVIRQYIERYENVDTNRQNIDLAYQRFTEFFFNPERQENIRNSKEEEFQEVFLRELFVKVLGYTIHPNPDYNLRPEVKNPNDARRVDAAILFNDAVQGLIELKDTKTRNLASIEPQAFGYKAQYSHARYIITSNFSRLRFYIDDATVHLEFKLFTLSRDEFALMYLCLARENLEADLPATIKEASKVEEQRITESLYSDYSNFKYELYADLCENNPELDRFLLFKKAQKLLDRFIFIFFAEDRGLIPLNFINTVNQNWEDYKRLRGTRSLYEYYKLYFEDLNRGNEEAEIFAYNGGLFKPDEVLNSLIISDHILKEHNERLSAYDFESEVSVNILGHIFENSLTDLEKVGAQIQEDANYDPRKSKRKEDGIFYTPAEITRYLVESSLGRLCAKKCEELGIYKIDENISSGRYEKSKTTTRQKALDTLQSYRDWLLSLKIADIACGSGAFLNAVMNYLIVEHGKIDDYTNKIYGHSLPFADVELSILERNIYGVDINEEASEIAKLSLWLHTAKSGRTLSDLSAKIRCGDSLIDNPAHSPQAFNWQEAFPEVFANGGFDVIVTNPPYVQLQKRKEYSDKLQNCGYESFEKSGDLYCLFTERGYHLLKKGGYLSYIMPNKWLMIDYAAPLRNFVSKCHLVELFNFGNVQFFSDANVNVSTFVMQRAEPKHSVRVLSVNKDTYPGEFAICVEENSYDSSTEFLKKEQWVIIDQDDKPITDLMDKMPLKLKDLPIDIYRGILTGYNKAFYIDDATKARLIAEDPRSAELIVPHLRGRNIRAWYAEKGEHLIATLPSLNLDINEYPAIKRHLLSFGQERLEQAGRETSRKKTRHRWFETQDSIAYYKNFTKPKIIYPNMTSVFPFMYDESGAYINDKGFIITSSNAEFSLYGLLAILNSKYCQKWIWYYCPDLLGGTREIRKLYFENFPLPNILGEELQEAYGELCDLAKARVEGECGLQALRAKFMHRVEQHFGTIKLNEKGDAWEHFWDWNFTQFMKELKKKTKQVIKLRAQDEWEEYFNDYRGHCLAMLDKNKALDQELEQRVAALYRSDFT
ncbi:MAG: Eco57I restriction-modification methylase domain-containing protein [Bradymonadia bacterium]|jgi:type I restriction-modification system DNA methylase subunit